MDEIKPSPKSEAIEEFLTLITGKDRRATILSGGCMTCEYKADYFRDEISRKEYAISGMCQRCQDKVFGAEDN